MSAKDGLKSECTQLKDQGLAAVRLQPSSDTPRAPFPLAVLITVPQPANCSNFDIYDIEFCLTLSSFEYTDTPTVSVDPKRNGIDILLAQHIQTILSQRYKSYAEKQPATSWHLKRLAVFVADNFQKLLMGVPGTLEFYMGEDANGRSVRRFAPAIVTKEPSMQEAEAERASESDENSDSEEAREYWRRKKLEEDAAEERRKKAEAEERRRLAEEDPSLFGKPRQLSKKEQEELAAARDKQGKRLAKTGPRRKKFDAEAHTAKQNRDKDKKEKEKE
ncbi:hypothetical protein BC830DRAFT_1137427 [Chytriomyces sp. MP71]|nr:hypothetical protein BC830DRAFT_1137427 [Chytriomyces sp. MP71]